ncbi:hypothetical protein NHF50_05620 [Flavobacterium sp. NRK F10]|uniref:Uncharacterized protein n=1 Tax=Flavobacterium sediminis TaxID=2201181 RepID=A0A2U8QT95_9FLAO|nr:MULTISPECIES: hypothetical protein [Flavobacterium]AWM13400.1 hypothetical protein DI487_05690 [Flavobacterium sediminis]MCO6174516.1 hypothetical protein [Flavobacterium sp. NRK F10]
MKILTYVIMAVAIALIIFNLTQVDFSNPFQGDSTIASIGVVAGLCAIVLLLIFRAARKIDEKVK